MSNILYGPKGEAINLDKRPMIERFPQETLNTIINTIEKLVGKNYGIVVVIRPLIVEEKNQKPSLYVSNLEKDSIVQVLNEQVYIIENSLEDNKYNLNPEEKKEH